MLAKTANNLFRQLRQTDLSKGIRPKYLSGFQKIKVTNPVADLDGDEMTRISWSENKNKVIDDVNLVSEIPEPPVPFSNQEFDAINLALRNTIEYFELNTWWPAGWVRVGLQAIHAYTALPWWEVIAVGVLFGRVCLFPVTLINMRNAARLQQHQPEMSRLTKNLTDAQKSGDQFQAQFAMMQLANFQKKNSTNPLGSFKTIVPQMAYFMSYFVAIKRMASAPIESFKTEGFWIFPDLTATDPTYLLSILCATTLHCVLRLGVEMPQLPGSMGPLMKTVFLYGFPAVVLFSTSFFPSALLMYWCTSNLISLFFAALFRIPSIRAVCRLPPLKKKSKIEDANGSPLKNNPFTKLKDLYTWGQGLFAMKPPMDSKLAANDEIAFKKAGKGPVPSTYSYNPRERYPQAFKEKDPLWKFWKKN